MESAEGLAEDAVVAPDRPLAFGSKAPRPRGSPAVADAGSALRKALCGSIARIGKGEHHPIAIALLDQTVLDE